MRLRVIGYQVQVRLRTLLPCFHKAHIENLALMVVGMVFAQSFSFPAVFDGLQNVLRQAGPQLHVLSASRRRLAERTPRNSTPPSVVLHSSGRHSATRCRRKGQRQ